MKNSNKLIKSLLITMLGIAVVAGLIATRHSKTYADEKSWEIKFDKVSGNSALGVRGRDADPVVTGYRGMQAIGFDTYTGEDGYVFMTDDEEKSFSLSHFKMDDDGFCTKVYKRTYQRANIGHGNDLTIFRDENGQKWLIFAPCGLYDQVNTAKATDGSKIELGAIKLNDSGNPDEATVYSCDVAALQDSFRSEKKNIVGVTYKGRDIIDGETRQIFLVMNATFIYEAYAVASGNTLTFIPTGTIGKIQKPTLPSGTIADTQGITYHNNYVYITGEGKGEKAAEMAVARVSLSDLFSWGSGDGIGMEVYKDNLKSSTVTKHGPEGAFFTSLNEKSHLYIGVNRQESGKDDDEIMRSRVRY